jgi:uncharacterized membrane protein
VTAKRVEDAADFERTIGRILTAVTYLAVALMVIGVGLMIATGISPLAGGPPLDLATLPADIAALRPAGFLWLGLIAVIASPVSRVVVAGAGFARRGERAMALIALAVLGVIALAIYAGTEV